MRLVASVVLGAVFLAELIAGTPSAAQAGPGEACAEMPLAAFGGPGDRIGSGTLDGDRPVCLTFAASAGPHLLVFSPGAGQSAQLLDAAGREVTCEADTYAQHCALPADGTYSLVVRGGQAAGEAHDFQAAIYPLAGTQGCIPRAVSSVVRSEAVKIGAPMQVDCLVLNAVEGDVVVTGLSAGKGWLVNGSGKRLCEVAVNACRLSGADPYRIVAIGRPRLPIYVDRYQVSARVQTDAQGCRPVWLGRYGTRAESITDDRCRLLLVPKPGRYRVELADETNEPGTGTITDSAGVRVCDTGWCTFPAAGRYRLAAPPFTSFATVFLPEPSAEAGCDNASDEPTAAAKEVSFGSVGEYDCRILPTPVGSGLMLSRPQPEKEETLRLVVEDATGAVACDLEQLTRQTCVLRGEAPFRVLASRGKVAADPEQDDEIESFPLTFVRLGGTPACASLAVEAFGHDAPVNLVLDSDHQVSCFSVPAQHSATEVISVRRTSVAGQARVLVFGADGAVACRSTMSTASFALCRLAPGPATILVEGDARYGQFVAARRDVTGTATGCRPVGSTTVGTPAIADTFEVPDVHCYRVTAESTDRLMIGARGPRSMMRTHVIDPGGAEADAACAAHYRVCSVTGSAGYQVLVWGDAGDDRPYQLDAWTVWTAKGPAARCTEVPSVAYGFGPYAGTLSSTTPAVCVVTTRRRGDDLTMRISNPTAPADAFRDANLFAVTAARGPQPCRRVDNSDGFGCPGGTDAAERTAFLLALSGRVSEQPYRWEATCGTPPCGDRPFAATSVSPTSLYARGVRTFTIRGTSLHRGDTVRVTPTGRSPLTAMVTAVSEDRTVLTAQVDLTGAPAGPVGVEVRSHSAGVAPVYLPGALRVALLPLRATAAPTITGRLAVGATITATPGQWSQAGTSFTYRWAAGGVTIKGATGRSYAIPAALLGKRLTVTVTATLAGATPAAATSVVSAVVVRGAAAKATQAPTIRGTAKVGRKLTVAVGRWTPKPDAYRYEWRINGKVVRGAARASLKLTSSMRNKRLTVTVIAVRKGHADGRSTSSPRRVAG